MLNKLIVLTVVMAGIALSTTARAEEQLMVLWPKQRTGYDAVTAERAAAYAARGKAYTDHLYATGGETPVEPDADFTMEQDIQPVPINVGQVAEMVKGAESKASPNNQTMATPQ